MSRAQRFLPAQKSSCANKRKSLRPLKILKNLGDYACKYSGIIQDFEDYGTKV